MSAIAQTYWQAGIETTHGTPVAADRIIYELGPVPQETRAKEYIRQSRALYEENFEAVETHALVDSWAMKMPGVSFDDIVWWLQLAARGGVAAVGTDPYTWTFSGADATDDLDSATFEVADGVGAFELPYALCKSWQIAGKGGNNSAGLVTGQFDLLAQKLTAQITMTPALSHRTLDGSYMAFKNTALYIDDTAGGIGTTEIDAALLEFSIKMDNKITLIFPGNDGGYFSAHRREKRYMEMMLILLFNADAYSEFHAHFQANDNRYVELVNTGSGDDSFTARMHTKFETFDFPEDGPTRKVALLGRSIYDATLGYGWWIQVQNNVASI